MFKSTSTSLILLGILAVIVGVIAIAWPGVTILALVILFAVYAFIDAGLQVARAFSSGSAGPVFGHLLLGLVDIAAGVIALVWPGPTALVLVLIVGIWAFIGGFAEMLLFIRARDHMIRAEKLVYHDCSALRSEGNQSFTGLQQPAAFILTRRFRENAAGR